MAVDHADDEAVKNLFAAVRAARGRLDILVNNAAKLVGTILSGLPGKLLETADLLTVGLRSHYAVSYHAARF